MVDLRDFQPPAQIALLELIDALDAVVAVVKAAENRRYLYRMRFDRVQSTYRIFSTQVEVYDTKEVLRTVPGMDAPQPYTPASPMRGIVDFIEEFLTAKKNTTK